MFGDPVLKNKKYYIGRLLNSNNIFWEFDNLKKYERKLICEKFNIIYNLLTEGKLNKLKEKQNIEFKKIFPKCFE